ncbi:MAG: FGGY-family carbohydrate kinase, partial [Opitutales bacterium]|nr:FGGY-family carbohydrate kinase [Opitutales bacterium]
SVATPMEKFFAKTGRENLYNNTGIQFLFFNSIYQLFAHFKNSKELLKSADSLLFIPDYLSYALTGKKVIEESIASTSQLYNTAKHCWANSIISKLGFKKSLFKKAVAAPQNLGKIRKSLAANMTSNPSVICVAGHDTGSAVAAVPSAEKSPFWLSSGTWSIMGIELNKAVINADAYKYSFTNELGLCKTVRFSKNICGLWLMQECKRAWTQAGEKIGYEDMLRLAKNSAPFKYFIDPDAAEFAMPCDMPKKISDAIKKRYKKAPKDKGEILRCIYDSLSLKYAYVFEKLSKLSNTKPSTLHIIGGGSKDDLLCQFTANALNMQVLAGPAEATSLGNVAAQMIADKSVKDLKGARAIISASVKPKLYKPQNAQDFAKAYIEYKKQLKLS